MIETLTAVQKHNLEALNLVIGPNVKWSIRCTLRQETMVSRIDFSLYRLSTERIMLAQRLLLCWWTPPVAEGRATIPGNEFRKADMLLRFLVLFEQQHPNRAMCELNKSDWTNLLISMAFYGWGRGEDGQRLVEKLEKPSSKSTIDRITTIVRAIYEAYQHGEVSDGPEFLIKRSIIEKALQPELETWGYDWYDWKEGGTYGSIPFVVAHLLLADAIEMVRSPRTQQLLTYFRVVRDTGAHKLLPTFWDNKDESQCSLYRRTGEIESISVSAAGSSKGSLANLTKRVFAIPLHEDLHALHETGTAKLKTDQPFAFPWRTYTDLLNDYNEVRSAIYIIFLSLMGKRGPSEVRTLRGKDITPPDSRTGKNATMHPLISKTHQGIRIEQGVTNYIDEFFSIICRLSYFDKTGSELALFSALQSIGKSGKEPKRLSVQAAWKGLSNYYHTFCGRVEGKVDFDVEGLHPRIGSHQFRHAFAEFALRKFDGNVEELFRQHALHSGNHWWTKRYTADKLDEDEITRINRDYIAELIPRVLRDRDTDPDFVGAMALFIKKTVGERISVMTPKEAEQHVEAFCSEIVQVTAHEYGWCLLYKEFESLAQCRDSSGKPNPSATSWQKCEGCANFAASRGSHLATQTQILISHVDFVEQDIFQLPSLKRVSRNAIRHAIQLFPELKPLATIE